MPEEAEAFTRELNAQNAIALCSFERDPATVTDIMLRFWRACGHPTEIPRSPAREPR